MPTVSSNRASDGALFGFKGFSKIKFLNIIKILKKCSKKYFKFFNV